MWHMPQVIDISFLCHKSATHGITVARHADPYMLPTFYACPHDQTIERDPEGFEDKWPTIIHNSSIWGFWFYNTFVLRKWSTLD